MSFVSLEFPVPVCSLLSVASSAGWRACLVFFSLRLLVSSSPVVAHQSVGVGGSLPRPSTVGGPGEGESRRVLFGQCFFSFVSQEVRWDFVLLSLSSRQEILVWSGNLSVVLQTSFVQGNLM